METMILITGCLVLSAASLLLIAVAITVSTYAVRAIDWHLARMLFRRTERIEVCLEPADWLATRLIFRHGVQPFDPGARLIRERFEFLYREAGRPFPRGYISIDEEALAAAEAKP